MSKHTNVAIEIIRNFPVIVFTSSGVKFPLIISENLLCSVSQIERFPIAVAALQVDYNCGFNHHSSCHKQVSLMFTCTVLLTFWLPPLSLLIQYACDKKPASGNKNGKKAIQLLEECRRRHNIHENAILEVKILNSNYNSKGKPAIIGHTSFINHL
jgi:hypothetical protein